MSAADTLRSICDVCGNDYADAFQVIQRGRTYTFDSFECAIHKLAPTCAYCGCKVIGHGIETDGRTWCCTHCARAAGESRAHDRVA